MDSSLAIVIGGTAIFAGAVAFLVLLRGAGSRRAGLVAGGTTLGGMLAASVLVFWVSLTYVM
ncbi:hypothetical protein ABT008_10540 [Micromonospora sp. NPDC002389]|uniref:hypothetical protein n=1 Tax=Micromonospora sp. NPDC002389 TaxID=3154272 RepID=UPI00332A82A9